jgi:hypothetical protein
MAPQAFSGSVAGTMAIVTIATIVTITQAAHRSNAQQDDKYDTGAHGNSKLSR